ncbi:MAG: hypothetical protein GY696_16690 [Gammaproteobacteria bacterium]|nr:hypothetical protein [Gammaproteobacteria bacterium]
MRFGQQNSGKGIDAFRARNTYAFGMGPHAPLGRVESGKLRVRNWPQNRNLRNKQLTALQERKQWRSQGAGGGGL